MQIRHGRVVRVPDMAPALDLTCPPTHDQYGELIMIVSIAVTEAPAVQKHRMIE